MPRQISHLSQLIPDPRNARRHNPRNIGLLERSLQEVGAARSIVIDEDGIVLAGNGVLEAAGSAGIERVRVVDAPGDEIIAVRRTGLSQEQKTKLALYDNRVQELSDFDPAVLAELSKEIDLSPLWTTEELNEQINRLAEVSGGGSEIEDVEPRTDEAETLRKKFGVESGQLWELGQHRILCGDSTKREDVERLMDGQKATLATVDPPYNVGFDYDGKTVDDEKSVTEYEAFTKAWFMLCVAVSERQIVTPGCYNLASWLRWFDAYHTAPWVKTNAMTNGKVSRWWCWEPVLFFGSEWKRHRSNDVFDFPIGAQAGVANHPCPKPLKMWEDIIENYSEPESLVYEAFSGSGTTIIACEHTRRQCRAVEISAAYTAVVLQRWADLTRKEPRLLI